MEPHETKKNLCSAMDTINKTKYQPGVKKITNFTADRVNIQNIKDSGIQISKK